MINEVAKNKHFSILDLSSAYYQAEIDPSVRPFTGFDAGGDFYQFWRIPKEVKNGVPAFQRLMNNFIKNHNLKNTYAYLDDLTVGGATAEEHDENLQKFFQAAEDRNLRFK